MDYFGGTDKPVRRCVCASVTFARMKDAGIQTPEEAALRFGAGTICGSCLPYIHRMIETGETEFPVLDLPAQE